MPLDALTTSSACTYAPNEQITSQNVRDATRQLRKILTGTSPDSLKESVSLCHETGALCEEFRLGSAIVASVFVVRAPDDRGYIVLSPCGVCQERLFAYGPDVAVGIPGADGPGSW